MKCVLGWGALDRPMRVWTARFRGRPSRNFRRGPMLARHARVLSRTPSCIYNSSFADCGRLSLALGLGRCRYAPIAGLPSTKTPLFSLATYRPRLRTTTTSIVIRLTWLLALLPLHA
eukprot:scaffold285741_cov29-Tisochrysis_lutea.AAC.2